jgi:hypothetical protein|tara:strand:- start:272 stop:913 length:642 start_codon:yes stop_codon:yes gene_type:complete
MKHSTKLRDSAASEIANQLDKVSAYIDSPPLTQVQKVSVIDFLISEFGSVPVEELGKAVKMVLAEKLETSKDVAYISKQSVGWWGTILSAWVKHKRTIKARPEPVDLSKPRLEQFTGVDGKDRVYYEKLEEWYREHGCLPEYGWPYNFARRYATDQGILQVTAKDEEEVKAIARTYLRGLPSMARTTQKRVLEQKHLDYAVMAIHFKRLTKTK